MEEFNNTINELLGNVLPQPNSAEILVSLATALVFSFILWGTYRLANTAATYQPSFAATLVALALLSTILMCAFVQTLKIRAILDISFGAWLWD